MTTHAFRGWLLVAAVAAVVACFVHSPPRASIASADFADSDANRSAPALFDAVPPEAAREGAAVLGWAIAKLESHPWVALEMRHEVTFDGLTMLGQGLYKQGPGPRPDAPRVRLEWATSVEPTDKVVLMQVCDGRWLWEYRDIRGSHRAQKVDVEAVLKALGDANASRPPASEPIPSLGFGGLPQLLRTLQADLAFARAAPDPARPDCVRLVGTWKPEALARIVPKTRNTAARPPRLSDLPAEAPTHAELEFDATNACPRRLRWAHSAPATKPNAAPPAPVVLATIEFFNELFDEPQPERAFEMQLDPALVVEDATKSYLQRLGLAIPETPGKK